MMGWLIIILYVITASIICAFSLAQFNLAWHYLKSKKNSEQPSESLSDFPYVTVQLPLFNEKYVVERLLDSIFNLNYPKDKLEIQILDDSTDETTAIIANKIAKYGEQGIKIDHIRRASREGYKAGALQYGMGKATGEYLAIFDADFIPHPDFLKNTLSKFVRPEIGMVQTKWCHLNDSYSFLTKAQAFWLDAHFTVEQKGRECSGSFINFNGTSGIWKKECILDAGGWQHDTLTEDLDLSYRAQLKGWKFVYREEIESPAELPILIPAIKSQQYRWNKGAAETARKTLGNVLRSSIHWKHKVRAAFHLLNSSVFLLLLVAAMLSIPMIYLKANNPSMKLIFDLGSIFIVGFVAIGFFYWVSSKATHPEKTLPYFLKNFPRFLIFSMGMALHNSIAVIEGYLGIKTPFVRTPKFNITNKNNSWKKNAYLSNSITPSTIFEGLLSVYFLFGVIMGIYQDDYGLLLLHLLMSIGFGYIFILTIKPINNAV